MITPNLISTLKTGLTNQMAADRLKNLSASEPAIMALLLNGVLHGVAKIESIYRDNPADAREQTVEIRISYHANLPTPPSHE